MSAPKSSIEPGLQRPQLRGERVWAQGVSQPTWGFRGSYKGSFKGPFKGIYRDSIKGIGFRAYLEVQG